MADDEGLSIEETNKLRLSLGLKPLNVSVAAASAGNTDNVVDASEKQERRAADNFKRRQEEETQALASRATAERVRKSQERLERNRRLVGATLGDDDYEEDTLSWIRRTKSAAPKQSSKVSAPSNTPTTSYSSADLAGLKVLHETDDIDSGDAVILTLKDSEILDDNAADELLNVDIKEKEELEQKLKSKKRKSAYTGYDDEEHDPDTGEKRILPHYDEDIDAGARKKNGFSIGSINTTSSEVVSTGTKPNRVPISLDSVVAHIVPQSDYSAPLKIKKPKKAKVLRRHKPDESIETVVTAIPDTFIADDQSFVDDDDLQASLACQRREAALKRAAESKLILMQSSSEQHPKDVMSEASGLILDETSEFTRVLQDIKVPEVKVVKKERSTTPVPDLDNDVSMLDPVSHKDIKLEHNPRASSAILGEEPTFNQGLGSALAALRQKGVLKEDEEEAQLQHSKEAWLAEVRRNRLHIEQERNRVREELRTSPKYQRMSARERESHAASENKRLDALEKKLNQEQFKNYKPNIELKYTDEFGRKMNHKEAFKYMSHKFHGKGSGSGKTAKKLAQIEKEKAEEQKSLFNR